MASGSPTCIGFTDRRDFDLVGADGGLLAAAADAA
jgi:hypothetical protein